jgi:glutamine amidotransferase
MGNLRSVQKAVEFLGFTCRVSGEVGDCEKLIIPGVGAFGAAMQRIAPLAEAIRSYANSGRPLLGICLGQQLLFDRSEEMGSYEGLGLIPGEVKYLPRDAGVKVPHVGWSPLHVVKADGIAGPVEEGEQVYFVHSLYTECADRGDVAAEAQYAIRFAAAVQRNNVWGTQFHPEKSGNVGLRILNGFLAC